MLTLHTLGKPSIGSLAATRTVDTSADPPYPRYTSYWRFGCKKNIPVDTSASILIIDGLAASKTVDT